MRSIRSSWSQFLQHSLTKATRMIDGSEPILLEEIRQIRKLLELLAEPAIAQRDARLREELRTIVGTSSKRQQSVLLMDGTRTQTQIVKETSMTKGNLSTMVS